MFSVPAFASIDDGILIVADVAEAIAPARAPSAIDVFPATNPVPVNVTVALGLPTVSDDGTMLV